MGGNRELAERFIASLEARDWDAWAGLLHPAVVYEIPQSRERIRGRDRVTDFWPEPYEPPPGREHLAERWLSSLQITQGTLPFGMIALRLGGPGGGEQRLREGAVAA